MILTTIGSAVAIVVSLIGAVVTLQKTRTDRRQGIADTEMNQARLSLDTIKMALDARDSLIDQLQEENARLCQQNTLLREALRDGR